VKTVRNIRKNICKRLGWLGLSLDGNANSQPCNVISALESHIEVAVTPTDEERVIGQHTLEILETMKR
jgi:acetate kinase